MPSGSLPSPSETTQQLSDPQADFFESTQRFAALMGGIGSGKSHVGVLWDHTYALSWPGALIVIAGPTNDNLKQTTTRKFFEIMDRLPGGRDRYQHSWNLSDRHFVYQHPTRTISAPKGATKPAAGSEVLFRGADDDRVVDRLRGMEIAAFHIDEAPLCPPLLFTILIGRLRQAPVNEDIPGYPHYGRLTGTHKGKDWVYRTFEPEDGVSKPAGLIVHCSVYDNQINLPDGYIESLELLYKGEWAKQELLGLHAKFEGMIYSSFDRATHVIKDLPPMSEIENVSYGVDWGYHYAPIIPHGTWTKTGQEIVLGEGYFHNVTLDDQIQGAKDLISRYGDGVYYADPSRPENILSFKRAGLWCPDYEPGKVDEGLAEMTRLLAIRGDGKPGMLVHESAINWMFEAESYQWDKRSGYMDGDANAYKPAPAPGQQDHAMDASRYNAMGRRSMPVISTSIDPDPYYDANRHETLPFQVRRR